MKSKETLKNRKSGKKAGKPVGERLKHSENQEDCPTKLTSTKNEDKLLNTAYDYQENGTTFEHSFAFTTIWNTSTPALVRHDNVEKVACEDLRASCDDELHRNFPKEELIKSFGCAPIEPSMDCLIKAFGSKKLLKTTTSSVDTGKEKLKDFLHVLGGN